MRPIDFDQLKQLVTYRQVLDLLGWRRVRTEAGRWRGGCPIHQRGREHGDCFAVGPMGFTCFSCKRNGDQFRLWAEATGQAILPATHDLCRRLGVDPPWPERRPRRPRQPRTEKRPR